MAKLRLQRAPSSDENKADFKKIAGATKTREERKERAIEKRYRAIMHTTSWPLECISRAITCISMPRFD
ncbi:hypothetical protein V2J09_018242 [Rumex salicifolius]